MPSARRSPTTLLSFCAAVLLCASALAKVPDPTVLETVVTDFLAEHPDIPGIMVHLRSDMMGLRWSGAAGVADRESGTPIRADQPARLASTTKSYVAAAILRLAERGKLDLDGPIERYLSDGVDAILRSDGYATDQISVRHLLTHTGGIGDHLVDAFIEAIQTDRDREWTLRGTISFMTEVSGPLGPPGAVFLYSDGGYILLGDIVQTVSGTALGPAVRDLLRFDALGLRATWWEVMEPDPPHVAPRVGQYLFDSNIRDWQPTFDLYGGGGLVATMPEVAKFYEALFEGRVFTEPTTLATMLTSIVPERGGPFSSGLGLGGYQYCLGIFASEHAGYTIFGHSGAWGTVGGYVPALDLAFGVSISILDRNGRQNALLHRLIDELVERMVSEGHE